LVERWEGRQAEKMQGKQEGRRVDKKVKDEGGRTAEM